MRSCERHKLLVRQGKYTYRSKESGDRRYPKHCRYPKHRWYPKRGQYPKHRWYGYPKRGQYPRHCNCLCLTGGRLNECTGMDPGQTG